MTAVSGTHFDSTGVNPLNAKSFPAQLNDLPRRGLERKLFVEQAQDLPRRKIKHLVVEPLRYGSNIQTTASGDLRAGVKPPACAPPDGSLPYLPVGGITVVKQANPIIHLIGL